MKISQTFFELLPGQEIMMEGQTDRQTDKVIPTGPLPTSSGGALMRMELFGGTCHGMSSKAVVYCSKKFS